MKLKFILPALWSLFPAMLFAQGNLLVTPMRVIFEGKKQKQDLNLTNIGSDTAVYNVSFLHYRMMEDGSFKNVISGDSLSNCADKYLRIFPRRVVLAPRESQTIRLQSRRLPGMEPGEYSSRLYFRAEKKVEPLGLVRKERDSTSMSVSLVPVFGLSIPVFVRVGELEARLSLTDPVLTAVNDSVYRLKLVLNRSGNKSVYGNIRVEYDPGQGKTVEVETVKGIGIYTEVEKREYTVLLNLKKGLRFHGGELIISFEAAEDEDNKGLARVIYYL